MLDILVKNHYYIFVNHNYFIYRMEKDKIVVVNKRNDKKRAERSSKIIEKKL